MLKLVFERRVDDAYAIHNSLVEITRLIFAEGNPVGIKTVLAEMGLIKNVLRLPLVKASKDLEERIKAEMKNL